MQITQKQRIEAYQRAQDFIAQHPLPEPGYGEPKRLLDEVVARLTEHGADQASGIRLGKAEVQRTVALEAVLREQHLRPIAKIANATLKGMPGIDKATRMPKPSIAVTRLLAEAAAFREAAALYEETFVKNGRPADFLTHLDAAMDALRQAQLGKARNLGKRAGARAGLEDEITRGRAALEMLDALVTTRFTGNGEVLAKWRSARRIRFVTGGVGGDAATQGSTPKAA